MQYRVKNAKFNLGNCYSIHLAYGVNFRINNLQDSRIYTIRFLPIGSFAYTTKECIPSCARWESVS